MARSTTPPNAATRYIETTRGILSYSQLAPLLAVRVLRVEERIAAGKGDCSGWKSVESLALQFHHEIAAEFVPEWAGKWRDVDVVVGTHIPPAPHRVASLMRQYSDDLDMRMQFINDSTDLLLETLAFAEGRFLSIHPFRDFNGRVARLLLRALLHKLELPPVGLVPLPGSKAGHFYLEALQSADRMNWAPLIAIWKERFECFSGGDCSS